MKKIIKIFSVISLCVVLIIALSINAFAQETAENTAESPGIAAEENLFARVWEWLVANKKDVLDGALYLSTGLFASFLYRKSNKNGNLLNSNVVTLAEATKNNEASNKAYINAIETTGTNVQELYDLCNSKFEALAAELKQDSKILVDVVSEVMTILEILMSVYPNSKNLPQGVKDIINLKYAKCQELVGSDSRMSSVMQMIHNLINGENTEAVSV